MVTFAELVKTVEQLSEDEMDELQAVLRKKKEKEILKASEQALKDYEEAKTVSLSSPEEISGYFKSLMKDDH